MELYKNSFSTNLRIYRIRAGYKQAELAKKIGLTRQSYMRYESDTIQAQPTIALLCKLADILNIDVNTLVGYKSSIDLETAYKMFDVTIRNEEIDFRYDISISQHDKWGFDTEPYEKRVTITMKKKDFDTLIKEAYQIAYQNANKAFEYNRNERFVAIVNNDMYHQYLINLLNNIHKE